MKDFEEVIDEKKAAEDAMRMLEGRLHPRRLPRADPDDPEDGVAEGPRRQDARDGARCSPPDANLDDSELVEGRGDHPELHASSSGKDPYALIREPARVKRIAKGCGQRREGRAGARSEVPVHEADDGGPRARTWASRARAGHEAARHGQEQLRKQMARAADAGCPGWGDSRACRAWAGSRDAGDGRLPGMMPGMGGFPGMPAGATARA